MRITDLLAGTPHRWIRGQEDVSVAGVTHDSRQTGPGVVFVAVKGMKADGIEYEERMTLLEDVTYPRPLEELMTGAYEVYRQTHPWVLDHELRPKTVARDLFERAMTYNEYVAFYGLQRSEGLEPDGNAVGEPVSG